MTFFAAVKANLASHVYGPRVVASRFFVFGFGRFFFGKFPSVINQFKYRVAIAVPGVESGAGGVVTVDSPASAPEFPGCTGVAGRSYSVAGRNVMYGSDEMRRDDPAAGGPDGVGMTTLPPTFTGCVGTKTDDEVGRAR